LLSPATLNRNFFNGGIDNPSMHYYTEAHIYEKELITR